jgi:hypothetical protein
VQINHDQAEHMNYQDNISFLLDDGNTRKKEIIGTYEAIKNWQKTKLLHVGGVMFDDDTYISALQAADVIAWGVRRLANDNSSLNKGFEPIAKIFSTNHIQSQWKDEWLRSLSESIRSHIRVSPEGDVYEF